MFLRSNQRIFPLGTSHTYRHWFLFHDFEIDPKDNPHRSAHWHLSGSLGMSLADTEAFHRWCNSSRSGR
jgi:hypothetical protein